MDIDFAAENILLAAHSLDLGATRGDSTLGKLTGDVVEDERIWGSVEFGIGNMAWRPAASHSDGICLNVSIWLDGEQILDKGKCVHPELAELAKKLGKE